MSKKITSKKKFFLFILLCVPGVAHAELYDNRFIPLFMPPQSFIDDLPSSAEFDFVVTTASESFATDEKRIGIPEIFGIFDLNTLSIAITETGKESPLRSDLRGQKLPYIVNGRIQTQGFFIPYYQKISDRFSFGCSLLFMRSNSRQFFTLNTQEVRNLKPGDIFDIDRARREAFEEIGLIQNDAAQHGIGDIDAYFRYGSSWDYIFKCRKIWSGLSFGVFIPSGVKTTLKSAASIPYGGNGHTGLYVKGDALFEVQEDKKVGFLLEISKRLPKTMLTRMPVEASEPYIFGAVIGNARINPGVTVAFSPYFLLENLRDGLGLGVHYTLTSHSKDSWCDKRADKTIPVNLEGAIKTSSWGTDYFTINVFYDFGKVQKKHTFEPVLYFRWDIPSMLFVSHSVPKTTKVSIGMKLAY